MIPLILVLFFLQDVKPLVTKQGDIIYPLNVSLDILPALSRKIKLSVNVWTPELNAEAKVNTQSLWNDYYDIFVYNDPDEILTEVQNTFRCHGKLCYLTALLMGLYIYGNGIDCGWALL